MQSVLTLLREHVGNPLAFRAPSSPVWVEEHAPCKSGGHTTYALYGSRGRWPWSKKKVEPFPKSNFERTTPEHQKEMREWLDKQGYEIATKTGGQP